MSSISGDESEMIENEPVRRTRSGRAVKAVPTPKKKPVRAPRNAKKRTVEDNPVEEFLAVEEIEEVDVPENGTEEYRQVVVEPDENSTVSNNDVKDQLATMKSDDISDMLQPILEDELTEEIEEIEEIEEVTEIEEVPELEAPPPPVVSNKLPSAPIFSTTLKVKENKHITEDTSTDGVEIVLDDSNKETMDQDSAAIETEMANGSEEVEEQADEAITFSDVMGEMELSSSGVPVESEDFETIEQEQEQEQEQMQEQEQEQEPEETQIQEEEQPDEPMEVDESVQEEETVEEVAPSTEVEEETSDIQQDIVEQQEEETSAAESTVDNVVAENAESNQSNNQMEESQSGSTEEDGSKKTEPDTEAVSEDEFPTEAAAKEPETEAVSDEELPGAQPADLGETESVSEDELPPDSDKKRKAAAKAAEKSAEKKTKPENAGKRKLNAEGEYDPSSPTSETNEETPAKKAALAADVEVVKEIAKPASPKKKTLPELDKYWKAVNEDPADFTGWTYLLQYVDQENDAEAAREAYNKFLERYPYCYGYWRKYADYEKKKGDPDNVQTVFDKGLKAISLSVDLWLHYINHCKVVYEKDEDKLREQYERAIQACGLEFRSDKLWESYIKWELDGKNLNKVMALYDRLLTIPTLGYAAHFDKFQEFVSTNSPNRILSADDFFSIRSEVKALLKAEEIPSSTVSDDAPPGEEPLPNEVPPTDEETRAIREKIISSRRKMHKANDNAVTARWTFEEGIKRPYFHVKPLERCQLRNWKQYLDFEIEQKDENRIIILFERCLIACALYDEFWLRFIRYLDSLKGDNTDKIRDVYQRACTIHHHKKPILHLQWAAFEESHGNFDKSASILENIDNVIPNMLLTAFRRINLERRRNDYDKACSLYEHYINNSKNRIIGNIFTIKYARFLCKFKNDIDKAIKVLLKAKEQDKENPRLYLKLIDLGLQRTVVDINEVVSYMDMFIEREHIDLEQKLLFAQRKIEFLEDFSTDVKQILKAHEQFQKYVNQAVERKKTKAEDAKVDASSPKRAKVTTDATAVPPPSSANTQSSYQYRSDPSGAYQSQQQFTNTQYGNQSGYQQSYQQYPPPSDPNYANYQNWQYSQSGPQAYGPYNQWGSYNYY